ncbi:MAG: MlaD family protein [Beijerinckiaceae bacterium]|jgi:phospholipid/cholesterol/gamma-HCH transport system substrate-binding protein
METRANYALIGAFTLTVIISAFAFVFWFSGAEKPLGMHSYKVVFNGAVTGLSVGNYVLFNGVRVGEVDKIDLMKDDPSQVYALISVDARVPVRTDTKARLEYSGLTGSASVGLAGGSSNAPVLTGVGNTPPVLTADRSDFQDLMQTAQRIAGRASDIIEKADKLLDSNSGSIDTTVKNVAKFSDALASNSDGIKDFMSAVADVGRSIKPLTVKLESLTSDTDDVVKAVDPKDVKQIVSDLTATSSKLNTAAGKVDTVLTNLNGFLSTTDSKGVFEEVSEAAKSIRRLADDTDSRTREILFNLTRFSNTGLKQYEGLATDGRQTLVEVNKLVHSVESNPTQFLFGRK